MNRIRHDGAFHTPPLVPRLLAAALALTLVITSFAAGWRPAMAQMEYDYNGDGKVTCADFEEEFPDTYTDEATKALQQYPDELKRLNANSEENDVACEGQPASEGPAGEEATPAPETPAPEPAPAAAPEPAATAPESSQPESIDVPADVMARFEGCAVVAISSRGGVGAGCPGVGTVTYHIPDDAPPMKGTVITHPGAALPTEASGASPSSAGTRSTASNQSDESTSQNDQSSGKAGNGKSNKDDSANTSSDKNKKAKDDKDKKKGKHDKDKKGKKGKNGKKSKKQGKKGK